MIHKQSVCLALAVLLIIMVIAALPGLARRLVDCQPGSSYSLRHGRCVGHLEFDIKVRR
jgi:hypothetical protein